MKKISGLPIGIIMWGLLYFLLAMNMMNCHSPDSKIKLLIVTGGHDFEEAPFFEMFHSFPEISYTVLEDSGTVDPFSYADKNDIGVLVFYHMTRQIFEDRQATFLKLLQKGKGMIFLHHSLVAYQNWPEFEKIIGGRYFLDSTQNNSPSTYHEDVDFSLQIVNKNHQITRGLNDFQVFDEVYGNFAVQPNVQPLLQTNHPESNRVVAWTNEYRNSRIVYIQPGHGPQIFKDVNYRKLLWQAIQWVAGK